MSEFRILSDQIMASPQISLAQVAEAKEQGVSLVICNRPDDEEPGQLNVAEISAEAEGLGMKFLHIPITQAGFSEPQIDAMREALDGTDSKVLAYCRTGTRSTLLWALAEARNGGDPDVIATQAQAAGYDVTPVRPAMDMFAGKAAG